MKKGYYKKLELKDDTYRLVCFIQIPDKLTVAEIVEHLFWAKTWQVEQLWDTAIIRCRVKPPHWNDFVEDVKNIEAKFLPFTYKKSKNGLEYFCVQTQTDTEYIYER